MLTTRIAKQRSLIVVLILTLSLAMLAAAQPFPDVIPLPVGFAPEGIASGNGTIFYVGSIPTGDIFRGDLRTGEGEVFIDAPDGRNAIGMKFDPRSGYLFVAGGPSGKAYVYDTKTGATVAEIQLSTDTSFINDVVVTRDAVYFTDSFQPLLYSVSLERNGQLAEDFMVEEITLSGDYQFDATPGAFNANGIAATPNSQALIIVNSNEGALYQVDPVTGVATRINLHGGDVTFGDGILLQGKTLYVVQNQLNQIAAIELNPDLSAGTIVDTITSSEFRVPTTIARFGNSLYAVNARFGTPPAGTEYEVVRVPRK
jgi:sugar lactone lactonase YvrE